VPDEQLKPVEDDGEDQTLSDLDQTASDSDRSSADLDQAGSDADQHASRRDQLASDRDQDAADEDQALGDGEHDAGYARSRRARSQSTTERDLTVHARSETSRIRDEAAARRDRRAEERDAAARARDELAAALDAEIERLELDAGREGGRPVGIDLLLRAAGDRKRAAASRAKAAMQREAAARDREQAGQDRRQAELDRAAAAEELALEGVDHLTGALRRRVGLAAIQRELDRTHRTGERVVVAYVDVDGLKTINDTAGHAAGDDLLREVVRAVMGQLRSYDVIARLGGDEFVCSLSGQDASWVRDRFDRISAQLELASHGATFTVGLAERQDGEGLDELIRRADKAMLERRGPQRG